MTIESGPSQGVANANSRYETRGTKGKQHDPVGALGFMSVMASVEAPDIQETTPTGNDSKSQSRFRTMDVTEWLQHSGQGNSLDTSAPARGATWTAVDDGLEPPWSEDPLSFNATPVSPAALLGADATVVSDKPMDAAALLAQSAVWSGTVAAGDGGVTVGAPTPLAGVSIVTMQVLPNGPPVASQSLDSGGSLELQPGDALKRMVKGGSEFKTKPLSDTDVPGKIPPPPDGKADAISQRAANLQAGPLPAPVGVTPPVVAPFREEQTRERSVFRSNGSESAGASQGGNGLPPILTVNHAPELIASTEVLVAEKISYWISNNIQNAEVKLEGFGEGLVEVSIRMQGNEAHVSFRTDELQTRTALENAEVHLKDVLQREGLVLSGVSVGTSGAGDSAGQDRRSGQHARQATLPVLETVGAERIPLTGRVSGVGLDLFV